MRGVKFRFWHRIAREMIFVDMNSLMDINKHPDMRTAYEEGQLSDLMLFTGLTDKKGNEIYEGDIVDKIGEFFAQRDRYIVTWDSEYSCFRPFASSCERNDMENAFIDSRVPPEDVEIIGNVFENPELSKKFDPALT